MSRTGESRANESRPEVRMAATGEPATDESGAAGSGTSGSATGDSGSAAARTGASTTDEPKMMGNSRAEEPESRRAALLHRLAAAGRELSDAVVLFHTVLAERLGLGASDWKTLGLLERRGAMTAGELAAHTGLAPASVTGILDRLERGGWVHRHRDPEDGRRVVVTLDEAVVAERVGACFAGLQRRLAELYERYSDDQLEFLAGFMEEIAARQREATGELQSGSAEGGQ